jgi:hypothetical protein
MKIIKLTQRHKLGQAGFSYALQFTSPHNKTAEKMHDMLWDMHGSPYNVFNERWYMHGSRQESQLWGKFTAPSRHGYRKHWIGFVNESDITALILKV